MEVRKPTACDSVAQPGYQKTDAGHIPVDWRYTRLTGVARLESGHTPSRRKPSYWAGDIPWVSLHDTESLDANEIAQTAQTISAEGLKNSSARLLPKGTVIFSRTATVGKASVIGREMATSQDFANYICGPEVHNHFLVYLFRHMAPEWKRLMAGSIHNTVYMPAFRSLNVILPPRFEQEAIAEALSDADALIESLSLLLAKKRQIKRGAMQGLLTGKKRLPGFSLCVAPDNSRWPVDWRRCTLSQIADVKTGPFGTALHEKDYVISGTPIITVEHLGETGIKGDGAPQVSVADVRRLQAYTLKEGDIVFSRVGSVDRNAWVGKSEEGWLFSGRLLRLRITDAEVNFKFLSYLFQGERFKQQVVSVAVGQTMASLNTKILNGLEIFLPPLDEQNSIAQILSDMEVDIAAVESRLAKAKGIKQAMAQELLTGRTRLNR
ncbi:restriction endonuclease subunit S [Burkholderia ambifaria]|uniref:restriction endonuclease subunit S n=1 Tax=Burkholderia ambifaria TaxID=152480 RepID=UPI00158D6C25|nr:restriction endonuclease subunit S [Burkholderia ambifaria]